MRLVGHNILLEAYDSYQSDTDTQYTIRRSEQLTGMAFLSTAGKDVKVTRVPGGLALLYFWPPPMVTMVRIHNYLSST